jgi:hypothetical protein
LRSGSILDVLGGASLSSSLGFEMRATRKLIWVLSVGVAAYVLPYAANSRLGGYWVKPEMDGGDSYSFGLAMPTAVLWQPRWGHRAIGDTDFMGMAYAPLIWLDRRCVHSTIYLSDVDGFERASHLTRAQIHPEMQDLYGKHHTNNQPKD